MPAYSFESFVVDAASRDAYAIEGKMRFRRPEARVRRTPAADFIDELVDAIRRDRTQRFRQSLADLDALLLDDVRLRDKSQTMTEILHNLNDVLKRGAPRRIPLLDQWLRSHAGGGIAVSLRPSSRA